jgi:aldehyde dehydrogenase (NAD+)
MLKLTTLDKKEICFPTGLFIDGKFVPSVSGKTFSTVNPSTG